MLDQANSYSDNSLPVGSLPREYIPAPFIERHVKKCCASVLTIIEASFRDPIQREAVKDLVKKEFNRTLNTCREWRPDVGTDLA